MSLRHIRRARAARADVERNVQQEILQLLDLWMIPAHAMGGAVRGKAGAAAARGAVGVPDILGWLPWGQALAIEVKRPKLSYGLGVEQAKWILETARRSPWSMIMIATSRDDVRTVLEPLVTYWRCDQARVNPIGLMWGVRLNGGCPELTRPFREARDAAVAAAEAVLEKERARPRPGVPANLL